MSLSSRRELLAISAKQYKEASKKQRMAQLNPAALHRQIIRLKQELRRLAADYMPDMNTLASLCDILQEDPAEMHRSNLVECRGSVECQLLEPEESSSKVGEASSSMMTVG